MSQKKMTEELNRARAKARGEEYKPVKQRIPAIKEKMEKLKESLPPEAIHLSPAQEEIAKCTKRFRVVNCGRRFGKTTLSVLEIIAKAYATKEGSIAYIAPTIQQARDIAWQELKKRMEPITKKVNESRLEIEVNNQHKGVSKVSLRGWENVETLRGQKFHFLVIDEVASMRRFQEQWQEVLRPALTDFKGQVLFIGTPKGFNHFYELYTLEAENEDFKSFHFTSYDNPNIPHDEIDKARGEMTEDRFAQEYMADFRKMQGLVYKEFDRNKHISKWDPENISEVIAGVDFGYTNPSCILVIKKDYDGAYWVINEWYEKKKTNEQVLEMGQLFEKEYGVNVWYPDPAEPDRIQEMENRGFNIRDVSKDIPKGIDSVRELFKANRLHVHPRCKNLILELESYAYPEKKDMRNFDEKPIKENDHALDALRYALHNNTPVEFVNEDFGLYNSDFT